MQSFGLDSIAERNRSGFLKNWDAMVNFLEENRQPIFFLFVFYVITIALFVERFIRECTIYSSFYWVYISFYFISLLPLLPPTDYSFMSEHLDLRHVMGVGIAITRGSAASLSFCYCLLLLTMSRNLLTKLKEHSLHQVRLFNNNFVGSNILEFPFFLSSTSHWIPTWSSTRSAPAPPSSSPSCTPWAISSTFTTWEPSR